MMTIVQILGELMPRVPGTIWTLVVVSRAKFSSSNLNLICSKVFSKGERIVTGYLWPGERSLIAKVEDKAGVHDVLTLNPRH